MGAWKYQIYFSCWTWYLSCWTGMISCSTLEINLVFPRTHVLFSIYIMHDCIGLVGTTLQQSLIISTRLLQVVNSLFQTCWKLGTSSANTTCEHAYIRWALQNKRYWDWLFNIMACKVILILMEDPTEKHVTTRKRCAWVSWINIIIPQNGILYARLIVSKAISVASLLDELCAWFTQYNSSCKQVACDSFSRKSCVV
jgi:hypothetical protein